MASKKKEAQEAARSKAIDDMLAGGGYEDYEAVVSGKNQKFALGDEIRGRIVTEPYPAGKSYAVDIAIDGGDDSESVTYWCPTILRNLLKKCKAGDDVVIRCTEMISTANGDAYDFIVLKRK